MLVTYTVAFSILIVVYLPAVIFGFYNVKTFLM
jgi:hypothetical protein